MASKFTKHQLLLRRDLKKVDQTGGSNFGSKQLIRLTCFGAMSCSDRCCKTTIGVDRVSPRCLFDAPRTKACRASLVSIAVQFVVEFATALRMQLTSANGSAKAVALHYQPFQHVTPQGEGRKLKSTLFQTMADALPKERKRRKWDEPAAPGPEPALPSSAASRFSDAGPVHTQTLATSAYQAATPQSNGMVQFNPAVLAGLNFSANFAIQPTRPTVMDDSALKVAQAAAAAVMARMVAQVRSIRYKI